MELSTGKILLAEPFSVDPNFRRSVVLLCDHESDGSVGFILNKKLEVEVNELIGDFPSINAKVFFGGPVQTDTIHYIHNVGDMLEGSVKVVPGVYWGGNFDKLKFLISTHMIKPENIRFFIGYSGWSPGQLAEEMMYGSWVLANMHTNYVFKSKPKELWSKIMNHKGNTFSVIAQMGEDNSLN
ncbi:MAG: YqgE/AlgH family protein [Bacteroidota bacterium]